MSVQNQPPRSTQPGRQFVGFLETLLSRVIFKTVLVLLLRESFVVVHLDLHFLFSEGFSFFGQIYGQDAYFD